MSFCTQVKNDLVSLKTRRCCKEALIYGLMLFSRSFSFKRMSIQTGNESVANLFCELARQVYGADAVITVGGEKRPTYKAQILSEGDRLKILASVDFGIEDGIINTSVFSNECCAAAFLRGAFLACGSINDPEKEYRAEFLAKTRENAESLIAFLNDFGINARISSRGKYSVVYMKESTMIEDLLTTLGATNISLDIMNTKIIKSVKNNINRRGNCDSGNISKTVEASLKQRKAIEFLEKKSMLETLPAELKNAALLRKKYPEATLKELCEYSREAVTVSGLNHRLKRIIEIYENKK